MRPSGPLLEALTIIDQREEKVAVVVHDDGRLVGLVTDGDVRRFLLKGGALDAPVGRVMNDTPTVALASWDQDSVLLTMRARSLRQVPVVDDDGRVLGVYVAPERMITARNEAPVLIMAGGRGVRLQPHTNKIPKPMLDIGGAPMLEIILKRLVLQGFHRFFFSVHHLRDVIIDHFGDGAPWGCSITYVEEDRPLGTGGALGLLPDYGDEELLVTNGDVITNLDYTSLLAFHRERAADLTVCARTHEIQVPFGVISESEGMVQSIVEKPVHRALVNSGIYVISPTVRRCVARNMPLLMTDLIAELVQQGRHIASFNTKADWIDVGRPEDLARVREEATIASRYDWLRALDLPTAAEPASQFDEVRTFPTGEHRLSVA